MIYTLHSFKRWREQGSGLGGHARLQPLHGGHEALKGAEVAGLQQRVVQSQVREGGNGEPTRRCLTQATTITDNGSNNNSNSQ